MTFDAVSGEQLDVLTNYPMAKVLDAEVPSPRPRALRTVFHFARTSASLPPDAITAAPEEDQPMVSAHSSPPEPPASSPAVSGPSMGRPKRTRRGRRRRPSPSFQLCAMD